MNSKRFLIRLSYLGFRYHGVQAHGEILSVQKRIEETLRTYFKETIFKMRFSSRTDAMVSALDNYLLLMADTPVDEKSLEKVLKRLPPDIQILETKIVEESFSLMQSSKKKVYHYYFAHSVVKAHPFASPYMTLIHEELDIELMKEGAKLFEGQHFFKNYCYKPKENAVFDRKIFSCEVVPNTELVANFFPEESFVFKIEGEGFLRGQVRIMMGTLFRLGKNEVSLVDIQQSLKNEDQNFVKWIVPSSGLVLKQSILLET